ncbi:hypothetical protein OP10G_1875 [Fimbriimonas ginsengisoli Gsoil 348]|uniref:Nicotinamide riboside transporter PnuC n=2 Tax=Fimbriimonas ginsengisoli TaxID=1005039 RepID=A0A068NNU8_FIMGI|nr:hypothetical protein OP10G_1875 [Fimbriimonas ginsengisoli Gsoil 348]
MGVLELALLGGIFFQQKWAFWVAGLYWGVGLVVIAISYLTDSNAHLLATVNPLNAFQVLIAPVYCWWRLATWRRHSNKASE